VGEDRQRSRSAETVTGDTIAERSARVVTSLLLMFVILAGVLLVREGGHYDNTEDGSRLFTIALLAGAMLGFVAWTLSSRITPAFSLSGPMLQLWLATLLTALVAAAGASFLNRTLATLTDRYRVAAIDSVLEGRGSRWYVVAESGDGVHERYLVNEQTATRLKGAKAVRMRYARGALGFDYVVDFEPVRP